jgi:cytochrome c553
VRAAVIALLLAALPAVAQQPAAPDGKRNDITGPFGVRPLWQPATAERSRPGDPAAGRVLAAGREGAGNWACHSCHGMDGAAEGSGAFPRLAGQSAWYLFAQLAAYASGERAHPEMTPIARSLTISDMQDVSAWYAAQTDAPLAPAPRPDVRTLQLGAALSAAGVPARGVTACQSCHGAGGAGGDLMAPVLAGQYAAYTALQLRLWKRGERNAGALGVMPRIASGMTEDEIAAAAAYFASVRPAVRASVDPPTGDATATQR